jgi:nucleotide-binding universal stress UspA family protein
MTTSTSFERAVAAPAGLVQRPLDLAGRTVLLATDGSPAAAGATRFAAALADRFHAVVHVLSVVDTSSAPIPPPLDVALGIVAGAAGESVHDEQVNAIRRMIADVTQRECDWPTRVKLGVPARAIVREAKRLRAELVILGLQRHGKLARALNDETVLSVMRTASCPVIGVAPDTVDLPRRIVVAVDFSAASVHAARVATSIADERASLALTYVQPMLLYPPGDGENVIHELGVQHGFGSLTKELTRPGLIVDHIVLPHELSLGTSKLLLEYADDKSADLIAAGSAEHSRVDRWMIGSVSTDLVRDGRKSVLIVPPQG